MDALHAIERAAFDHVDGAPASDMLCRLADGLGRTQIMLAAARGTIGPVLLEDTAYADPDLVELVRSRFMTPETNPLFEALPRFEPDRLVHFSAYTSWDAIRRMPFYADFWKPSGVGHGGNYLTRFTPDWGIVFAFGAQRGRDWYNGSEARLAARGAATVARAIRLRCEIDDARTIACQTRGIEAEMRPARLVLLVDRVGTLVQASQEAREWLVELQLVRRPRYRGSFDGSSLRIVLRSSKAQAAFDTALHNAICDQGGCFALTEPRRAVITLAPGPFYRHRRTALMRIDIARGMGWTPALLGATYGLTPRECDVVMALCEGRSTDAIAESFGLAVSSVRLYLKRIMAKTGVHNQAQLVARMLGDA